MYKAAEPLMWAQNYLFHNAKKKAKRNKSLFKSFLQAAKDHTQIPAPADKSVLAIYTSPESAELLVELWKPTYILSY